MSQFPVVSRISTVSGAFLTEVLLILLLEAFRFVLKRKEMLITRLKGLAYLVL